MRKSTTRILTLFLACILTLSVSFAVCVSAVEGDVTGDGACTIKDVIKVISTLLNKTGDLDADVNGDGKISLIDVFKVLKSSALPDNSSSVEVKDGVVLNDVTLSTGAASATVPAGVAVTEGTDKLTLTVTKLDSSDGNIDVGEDEGAVSYDVHIEGVAETNTTVITVKIVKMLDVGLNIGNFKLYHVENGSANEMTQVSLDELDAHNEFYYDPATGDVTVAIASFSEFTAVALSEAVWEGNFDFSWYNKDATKLTIANADQLAAFGSIVGGMAARENFSGLKNAKGGTVAIEGLLEGNEIAQDSFKGKTVTLVTNINLNDDEAHNNGNLLFYPIGYYNSGKTYVRNEKIGDGVSSYFNAFEGTFDGAGHTIGNFYHNTWEMIGDHNWYSATEAYYRDGMGLFGKVYGGTVKNLTIKNFSSDGEIATTGTIAAYADCGATFENIAIFNCNPRVYNIGNGGIVGCVGWYAKEATETPVTFRNITVDNSNKISALWGSWDVACGGIVGQYYPTSGQTGSPKNGGVHFDNCHISAQIDVYNDVCANYQYYAYRYAGILMGSIRENETIDGYVYPKMDGITAKGCTVHFGDWNDYYYCELVANTLASYTHDHQMSRLEQVRSVDVTNKKVTTLDGTTTDIPSSGRYNYVVVKAQDAKGMWIHGDGEQFATCYHFVDGNVWNHADAGEETVDTNGDGIKETVLKEDKQLIYREFNNLFTGYGWGVTSKGLTDVENYVDENGNKLLDIKILDKEEPNSIQKFVPVDDVKTYYGHGKSVTLGELFEASEEAQDDNVLKIRDTSVTVGITVPDGSNASATVTPADNWEDIEITFGDASEDNNANGVIFITVQDYYFCTPTEIMLTICDSLMTSLDGVEGDDYGEKDYNLFYANDGGVGGSEVQPEN